MRVQRGTLVPQLGQNDGGPDFLRSLLHRQGSSSSRLVEPTRTARSNQGMQYLCHDVKIEFDRPMQPLKSAPGLISEPKDFDFAIEDLAKGR